MRRTTFVISTLGLALALGTVAHADETIRFKNGTYLTIKSHQLANGMVTVELGANSRMAFPVSLVESIERGGISLFRPVVDANTVASTGGGVPGVVSLNGIPDRPDYRIYASAPPRPTGRTSRSARRAAMMATDPTDLLYLNGDLGAPASASMFPGHEDASHSQFGVTGNTSLVQGLSAADDEEPTVIPAPEPLQPRGRAATVQQRMVPLPTHPSEMAAIRAAEGDSAPQKSN